MKQFVALGLLLLSLGGCTDEARTQRALDDLGFTDVRITGSRWTIWTCGRDYTYATGFAATNPRGKIVTGTVCSGFLVGTSVKFD